MTTPKSYKKRTPHCRAENPKSCKFHGVPTIKHLISLSNEAVARKDWESYETFREQMDVLVKNADLLEQTGFDADGFDINGLDAEGFNAEGRNRIGYDRNGLDEFGFNNLGQHAVTGTRRDTEGYNARGNDSAGFNREGFDRTDRDINGLARTEGVPATRFVMTLLSKTALLERGVSAHELSDLSPVGYKRNSRNSNRPSTMYSADEVLGAVEKSRTEALEKLKTVKREKFLSELTDENRGSFDSLPNVWLDEILDM